MQHPPQLAKLQAVFAKAMEQSLRKAGRDQLLACHSEAAVEPHSKLSEMHESFLAYIRTNSQHEFDLILAEHDLARRFARLKQLTDQQGATPNSMDAQQETAPEQEVHRVVVEQKKMNLERLTERMVKLNAMNEQLSSEVQNQDIQVEKCRRELSQLVETFSMVSGV
eukprot:TRINITY_DN10999_c0_g1_i3.p1 TRINITY_DN10999_c0_g1~~TRINITY_DN10999_c0_g1_i3.p1  ORF type:complete len:167 (-),score=47.14 TRINITY_DN10999_c0_g1_i3:520-1020(-)